jgi:hypothetical protein
MSLLEEILRGQAAAAVRRDALLQAALGYARKGFQIVPTATPGEDGGCSCREGRACDAVGKHPRVKGWREVASTDERMIRQWWRWWPSANIAVATGAGSGIIGLDVDTRSGGLASLARLEAARGALPATPTQRSGGGGLHVFLTHPGGVVPNLSGDRAIRPGVEIKGDGGLITLAPSRHASGTLYGWAEGRGLDDVPLAPVPDWVLGLITEKRTTSSRAPRGRATRSSFPGARLWHVILTALAARGPVTGPDGSGNFRTRCVSSTHPDAHPSMDVSVRGFVCRACGLSGGFHSLAKRLGLTPAGIAAVARE